MLHFVFCIQTVSEVCHYSLHIFQSADNSDNSSQPSHMLLCSAAASQVWHTIPALGLPGPRCESKTSLNCTGRTCPHPTSHSGAPKGTWLPPGQSRVGLSCHLAPRGPCPALRPTGRVNTTLGVYHRIHLFAGNQGCATPVVTST